MYASGTGDSSSVHRSLTVHVLDDLSVVRIHDRQPLRVAGSDEQPPALSVHRHGHGLAGLPHLDRKRAQIKRRYFVRITDIVVNHSLDVGNGLLWAAA